MLFVPSARPGSLFLAMNPLLVSLAVIFAVAGCSTNRADRDEPQTAAEAPPPLPPVPPPSTPADLVILNAKVWTGAAPLGAKRSYDPTAIAVLAGKIDAVGFDDQIRPYVGPNTKVIDAGGRRVIPGITDSHTHIVSGGYQLVRLNLRDVGSREEFVHAIATEAKTKKPDQWVLGGRWSVESWTKPESPNRNWLDPVTGDAPAFLNRMDGHQALVNSAALTLAGIDRSGPADPKGGEIERDPKTGEPTGILKESAMGLVSRLIPNSTPEEDDEALRRAMHHANSLGVTSMHNMSGFDDLQTFRRAEEAGALTVRITAYLSVAAWASYADRLAGYGLASDMARLVGFKGYMDGSLGSRTAYMREPFSDATSQTPYPRGQLTAFADDEESLQLQTAFCDAKGLQLAVHAIGDEGNHRMLDAYEYAGKRNGNRDARHRLEHAQHLLVEDIPRFATLGVVASMQPFHKADDGRYCEKAIGRDRLKGSYAFRQLVDSGALLVFGSDWPVVTLDPFAGLDSAVNARTLAGEVWLPSHSLTVEEALRSYTTWPAKAIHMENRLGTIQRGRYADLVILSEDPFSIPKERIGKIQAVQTIVNGKIVFTR